MKNDLNKDMFGEFDFMYRHKAALEKQKKEEIKCKRVVIKMKQKK